MIKAARQRFHVHRVLMQLRSNGFDVKDALANFTEFYRFAVIEYVAQTSATYSALDETSTPILDAITDFIKWAYESGFIAFLVELFAGAMGQQVIMFSTVETDRPTIQLMGVYE